MEGRRERARGKLRKRGKSPEKRKRQRKELNKTI